MAANRVRFRIEANEKAVVLAGVALYPNNWPRVLQHVMQNGDNVTVMAYRHRNGVSSYRRMHDIHVHAMNR